VSALKASAKPRIEEITNVFIIVTPFNERG